MKLLAVPAALVLALVTFPALFATGDQPTPSCVGGDLTAILATIRTLESGGDYTAQAAGSSASGAYQFVDATWNNYRGYPHASHAPPAVQDARAGEHVQAILDAHNGDIAAVPVVWYLGHLPAAHSTEWDQIPLPNAGNTLTPRQYQQRWLTEYDRQHQTASGDAATGAGAGCARAVGGSAPAAAGEWAAPGPGDLFAVAPVGSPHHDYPAWDWMIPAGTPIYAVRGGRVVAVQYWPRNWWDAGCSRNPAGCHTCGIGVTIEDDTGVRWAYCHANAVHVEAGDTITAGTRILTSGNTGRSSGPHLHLQIRAPDNTLRCPQPLLRALQNGTTPPPPAGLPATGCVA